MVKNIPVPDRGDIIWIDFDPIKGHEQAGRRPALVVSHKIYNIKSKIAVVCPITSNIKNYPFEVIISSSKEISGAILVDQVRSIDLMARNAVFVEKLGSVEFDDVVGKLSALLI